MNDELLCQLLDMGFELEQCLAASNAGCTSAEQIVNWISEQTSSPSGVLKLQRRADTSANPDPVSGDSSESPAVHSRYAASREAYKALAEKKQKQIEKDVIETKQMKKVQHETTLQEIAADKKARIEKSHASDEPQSDSPLQSRYSSFQQGEADYNLKLQAQIKEEARKRQELERETKERTLKAIQEDRAALQERQARLVASPKTESASVPQQPIVTGDSCVIQFRLPDGKTLRETFPRKEPLSLVRSFIGEQYREHPFIIAQPYPPKEFKDSDYTSSLADLGFGASLALIVKAVIPTQSNEAETPMEANADSASDEEEQEIPYQPLRDLPEEQMEVDEDEEEEAPGQDEAGPQGIRVGRPGRPPPRLQREPQFNFNQRLGSDENRELPDTPEARRQRAQAAALSRYQIVSPNAKLPSHQVKTLANYCLTQIVELMMAQRIHLSHIDSASAHMLLKMLKERNLLTSKTYQPFIALDITSLDLDHYKYLTNDLVRAISLSRLSSLTMRGCVDLTDSVLPCISQLSSLRKLDISGGHNFSCAALAQALQSLTNLEHLELSGTKFSDATFAALYSARYPNMTHLNLSSTHITVVDLIPVIFPNLHSLVMDGTAVKNLAALASLSDMKKLSASNCSVIHTTLADLGGLNSLTYLDLTNCCVGFSDQTLQIFTNCVALTRFKLPSKPSITDDGLKYLANLPLAELDLSDCINITDCGVKQVLNNTALQTLVLSNTPVTGAIVSSLVLLQNLEELSLDYSQFGDEGVLKLQGLYRLRTLSLMGTWLTDAIFCGRKETNENPAFVNLPRLEKLNLSRNKDITDFGAKRFKHENLQMLNLALTSVTAAAEEPLRANLPKLVTLKI